MILVILFAESEDEELFIECEDEAQSQDSPTKQPGSTREPEGRKAVIPGVLTVSTGEPLYEPFLQVTEICCVYVRVLLLTRHTINIGRIERT